MTFDLAFWVEVTQNVEQHPLHHVTSVPAKFEVTPTVKKETHLQEKTLFKDQGHIKMLFSTLHII